MYLYLEYGVKDSWAPKHGQMYVLHMCRGCDSLFGMKRFCKSFVIYLRDSMYLYSRYNVARIGNPRVLQSHFDAVSSQLEESLESPFLVVLALSLLRHDSNKIEICLTPNSSSAENFWKSVAAKTCRETLILLQFVTRWFR